MEQSHFLPLLPLIQLGVLKERCKLSKQVWAEYDHQMVFGVFMPESEHRQSTVCFCFNSHCGVISKCNKTNNFASDQSSVQDFQC